MAKANRKVVKYLKQLFASVEQATHETPWMLDRQDFYVFLEKERYRADRLNSPFSLILLPAISDSQDRSRCLQQLDQSIKPQVRLVDEMGWFNDNQVAIYLFNTGKSGAHSFLQRLQALKDSPASLNNAEILVYPDTLSDISAPDQRDQDRHDLELSANLLLQQGRSEQATTRDISARGVFLLTNSPLAEESKVRLDITLPIGDIDGLAGEKLALHATGKVVRSEANGVAIEFQSENEALAQKELETET
ncbi:PilZ domain-containing protein [Marinobacterium jannaschii]|uniref:PilZ domain-containing protein n=1 Tax=Marinobacterium jannaschii TaxID=64970 RepID=UPI0004878A23|nr:PilZ domain-containing protein [Marinobacterium jannaschii]